MSFLKHYFLQFRGSIFLGQFFKLVEAVLELFIPLVMASLIDDGVAKGNGDIILSRSGLMLFIAFAGVLSALICQVVATKAAVRFGTQLRHDVFSRLNDLSAQDLDKIGTASLVARVTGDIGFLQDGMAMLIRLVVRAPFLAIGAIVMALSLDISLSVVFLVTAPLITFIMFFILRIAARRFAVMQRYLDSLSRIVRETLSGTRVIRAFSQEKSQAKRFRDASLLYTREALRTGRLSALLSPAASVVMNFGIIAILLLGGHRVQAGGVEVGIIIAFIEYLGQILLQTAVVANLVILYTRAYASAKRVGELLDAYPSVRDVRWTEKEITPGVQAVVFEDVSVTYPDGKSALEGISFTLKKGSTLGIIGGTGSGKSSVASLILRLYDPTQGIVRISGQDARDVPLRDLRARLALVPQEAALLKGTVRQNLELGDPLASERTMNKALDIAQAEFVYELAGGLDFEIAENGRNLSGGQRQRLTIARALLKKADVLILDDAFSALDYVTERNLRRALKDSVHGAAVIFISQRVSSLRDMDQILVLDEGRMAGLGTHEELIEGNSVYREISASQAEAGGAVV